MVIPSYEHLGCKGELSLAFFNDRLERVTFVPVDLVAYLTALSAELPTVLTEKGLVLGHRHVWVHSGFWSDGKQAIDDRTYVGFADERLEEEEFASIMRYS